MKFKSDRPKNNRKNNTAGGSRNNAALTSGKKTVIIVMCVLAAIFAAAAAGVVYISTIDDIFPKVSVDGIDIGSMSQTEAIAALDGKLVNEYEGKSVIIEMPAGYTLEIASEDVLKIPTLLDAVDEAWNIGHDGGALVNAVSYLKCVLSGVDISYAERCDLDKTALRATVDNMASQIQLALMGSDFVVGEDSIRVVKGASSVKVDSDEVYDLAVSLFEEKNFEPVKYAAEVATDETLDLQEVYDTVFCEAQDAYYDGETDEIVPAVIGLSFDVEAAQSEWNNAAYGDMIEIPLEKTEPEISTEYLESVLFRDSLSYKATTLAGSSANRINNVKKACESINGIVLLPGEEFSYNEALGKRTPENGYLMAGAYNNGEVVSEYGGGICQVSSTLYYCALYANLQITSRTCHMFSVAYIEPGLDATVSWGGPEFKFRNDRTYPIMIKSWVDEENNTSVVEILGTDIDGTYVEMNYAAWGVFDEEYEEVEIGYKVQTYRSVYDANGNRISRKNESLSYYAYHEEDIEWPEESPSPSPGEDEELEPTPEPTPESTPAPEVTTQPEETPVPEVTPAPEVTPETPAPTEPVGE